MFDSSAKWIWPAAPGRDYNEYACLRRTVDCAGAARQAVLKLTADSRYELHVNGEWVGHGPPRS